MTPLTDIKSGLTHSQQRALICLQQLTTSIISCRNHTS